MFCYQPSLSSPTEAVTKEQFWALVRAPKTANAVQGARAAYAKGDKANYEKKKKGLPLIIFPGTFEEWDKEVEEKRGNRKVKTGNTVRGRWRNQAHACLNGLAVADFDHLEGDVRKVWETASGKLSQQDYERIFLVFITPSGEGLKVVFAADPETGNLIDNQVDLAEKLGLKLDESCKDASRGAFMTTDKDIILIDEVHLFTYHNQDFAERYESLYREGKSQSVKNAECGIKNAECGNTKCSTESIGAKPSDASRYSEFRIPNSELLKYHGVPYSQIVEAWLDGKTINPGDRHRTSLNLADHLRYITDNDPVLIETILRQTPFVDEIVRERNEDVSGTVASALKYQMYKHIPQRMREALEKAKVPELVEGPTDNETVLRQAQQPVASDVYSSLPFESWSKELLEFSEKYPCMKALFSNVHPFKIPAVLFSSAAMFGTLMTRTWYRFWYEPETLRRLNYSIFIIGDPGAGKNVVEKFYAKICDPMIQSDQVGIDAVNRYKEGRTERSTSTKAQKGEALKKPVVGIRVHPARTATGEFIRHMMAAKEQVQGHELNLHMFSFDAELDNVTRQNKGGDYKDREILEIKAFHNETDGQMYANSESITAMFKVYWNFIYTGTPYALHRKVNQKNFGTGLSTRLAVIPLPDMGKAARHQEVNTDGDEELKTWAYRLDRVEGELPIEPLNDETYEWQSDRMDIAEFNDDKADRTLLKRIPYYGIGISLPYIVMRHWDEWQEKKTLTIDDTDRRLCRLAMDIQYRCQQFFFGEMAHNYFEDQTKEFVQRHRTRKYDECFRKLPDEFKTEKFMECFGCSQSAASRSITRLKKDGVIKNVKFGVYKKILKELP